MRLTTKLEHWQKAGLLSDSQVDAILRHERQKSRFSWQNGLYFVAVFAIVIGILAIIAANWQQIPGWLKLATHFLVNAGTALAVLRAEQAQRTRLKELCLLAWFGLNLTFIGLIGQVFHLSSNLPAALSLWLILSSAAIVMLANHPFTLLIWLVACLLTLVADYGEYLDPVIGSPFFFFVLVAVLLPTAMAAASQLLAQSAKTVLHRLLAQVAPLLPIIGASVFCQFWYSTEVRDEVINTSERSMAVLSTLLGLACSFYPRVAVPEWLGDVRNLRLLLIATLVTLGLPHVVYWLESELLAALSFIAFWLLLGYIGHRTNTPRLISISILVITIRVYIVYLEVFGSLLQTGFGLIGSGIVLLVMLKVAQLLNRNLQGNGPEATEMAES